MMSRALFAIAVGFFSMGGLGPHHHYIENPGDTSWWVDPDEGTPPIPAQPEKRYTCPAECFKSWSSTLPMDCEVVALDITAMLYAYDMYGPGASPEICEIVSTVDVTVRPEASGWVRDDDPTATHRVGGLYYHGTWSRYSQIWIARDMNALAHEVLHHWEAVKAVEPSGNCPGLWEKNTKYMDMMILYRSLYRGLDCSEPKPDFKAGDCP